MLWAFGDAGAGQLGVANDANPPRPRRRPAPERVVADSFQAEIKQVACGESHSLAIDSLGGVYCWGRSREGQGGTLDVASVPVPRVLASLLHASYDPVRPLRGTWRPRRRPLRRGARPGPPTAPSHPSERHMQL